MIQKAYRFLHRAVSRPEERGEYSAGAWGDLVRSTALSLCAGRKGRLLEIGCGEGLFLSRLRAAEPGLELFGVDTDARRVEECRARAPGVTVAVQDGKSLDFLDGSFNTAVLVNVIFNLPSPGATAAVMREAARVLRPGGSFIFDFRNADNLLLRVKYRLAPWYDPTVRNLPLRMYTPGRMKEMLAACGLSLKASYPLGMPFPAAPLMVMEAVK